MTRIGLVLAALGAFFAAGTFNGIRLMEGKYAKAQLDAAEKVAEKTAAVLAAEQKARLLTQALEDQAYADPVAVPVCLSADRVRRLNLR